MDTACESSGKELETGKVYISHRTMDMWLMQTPLTSRWQSPWFINVNDKTVEGLLYLNEPIKTVQFHPEANAGPKDSELLFDEFMKMMSK